MLMLLCYFSSRSKLAQLLCYKKQLYKPTLRGLKAYKIRFAASLEYIFLKFQASYLHYS